MSRTTLPIQLMILCGVEDALIGDIHEQGGRAAWLWTQAVGAIVGAIRKDFAAHWVLALRAVLFGMIVWQFAFRVLSVVFWRSVGGFYGLAALIGLAHPGLHATAIATMFLALPVTACLGWTITRLHPTPTPMPVIAFVFVVCLFLIPSYARQLSNAIGDTRFRPYLFTQTLSVCAFTLSVFAGGLWPLRRSSERRLSS
jgi:hypothetical protein